MIPSLDKDKIAELEYDIVIVGGQDVEMIHVLKDAKSLGVDENKLILDRTVCIPGFTLERYNMLRHSPPSIIARNCWGGLIYHLFGLQFLSPTINMFFEEDDFLKLCYNLQYYFDKELRFLRTDWQSLLHFHYPVFLLGDIKVHMNHYPDINQAREKWEGRRLKINWYNLLVEMHTEDQTVLTEFDRLPFAKKVCFVPFETKLYSGYQIPPKILEQYPLTRSVNLMGYNTVQCFDLWDLLLYGKKTPINQ